MRCCMKSGPARSQGHIYNSNNNKKGKKGEGQGSKGGNVKCTILILEVMEEHESIVKIH